MALNALIMAPVGRAAPDAGNSMAALVLAELPFLRRAVRRWHQPGADAEDLVQDTVLRALANAHLWEKDSNLRGWLVAIMRNQFLSGQARSKRAHAALRGYTDLAPAPRSTTQDDRLLLDEVEQRIAGLPDAQRIAIRQIGIDGRSHDDVAHELGVSAGAMRCHLARARARLRKAFGATA